MISDSAGTTTGWDKALATAKGRPASPPAHLSSSACSGIREPIVAAVYWSAKSAPRQIAIGNASLRAFARS